jgi:hypothetical protein
MVDKPGRVSSNVSYRPKYKVPTSAIIDVGEKFPGLDKNHTLRARVSLFGSMLSLVMVAAVAKAVVLVARSRAAASAQ